jgi:hypothetical protein
MYVKAYKDRHGKQWFYFRRKGQSPLALPGNFGSPEFLTAYQRALAAHREPGNRSAPGSISATIEAFYRDQSFQALAESTRATYRRHLEKVRDKIGGDLLRGLEKGHIVSGLLAGLKPFARNAWLKTLRAFFRFAVEGGFVDDNPTAGIAKSAAQAGSIHTSRPNRRARSKLSMIG